jgi:hypothetical protein
VLRKAVLVGPRPDGAFIPGSVRSIHRDRLLHADAAAGQACCLAVVVAKDQRPFLRRGMAVLAKPLNYDKLAAHKDKQVAVYKDAGPPRAAAGAEGFAAVPAAVTPAAVGVWEFEARLFVVSGTSFYVICIPYSKLNILGWRRSVTDRLFLFFCLFFLLLFTNSSALCMISTFRFLFSSILVI